MTSDRILPEHVPLAVTTRGDIVEAVHYGSVAVVDRNGGILQHCGDVHATIFPRSCLKPLQALPLIAHPDVNRFAFTAREIALMCASHSAEPRHAEAVVAILEKTGCEKRDLLCGTHAPLYFEAMGIHPRAEDIFTVVHHNCSGKHAGMLALAKLLGASIDNYVDAAHPVQQAILDAVSEFSGLPRDRIIVGIDGCSAPAFAMPLAALARAFACFGGGAADGRYDNARATITAAMIAHPEMVSGIKRMDLALAHAGHGDWLPKSGAEAVHALSVLSGGFGIAVKIADGATRALHVVIVETLRQLGLIGDLIDTPLESYARPTLYNSRDVATGEVVPVFKLRMA